MWGTGDLSNRLVIGAIDLLMGHTMHHLDMNKRLMVLTCDTHKCHMEVCLLYVFDRTAFSMEINKPGWCGYI